MKARPVNLIWLVLTVFVLAGCAHVAQQDAVTLRDPHVADFSFVMAPREVLNLAGPWQLTGGEADFVPPQGDD